MADDREQRVADVVAEALADTGVDVEGVRVRAAGRRRLVEVLVDADGGVTLDRVADISQLVSAALDASAVMGEQPYVLDVGSPGVERPLTLPRHWRRNTGRLVRVRPTGGGAPIVCRIRASTETGATLVLERGEPFEVSYDGIEAAVVQVEFGGDDGHRH